MARLLFDATEPERFCLFNQAKLLSDIGYKSPVYSSTLCNNIFVAIWIFLCNSFEK